MQERTRTFPFRICHLRSEAVQLGIESLHRCHPREDLCFEICWSLWPLASEGVDNEWCVPVVRGIRWTRIIAYGRPIARESKFGNESCPASGRADPVMTRQSLTPGLAQLHSLGPP